MERKMSINITQKDILVNFLKENEQLQSGRFSTEFTFKKAQAMWQEVTETLNSVPNGAQKEWRQWRKTWQDMKKHTKTKAAEEKKHALGTGGGAPASVLSKIDKEILELMNPIQVEGLNIEEAPLIFHFNDSIETYGVEATETVEVVSEENPKISGSSKKNLDHDYVEKSNKTPKRKKITKTTRLQNSLELSNCLLASIEHRNKILENHYREKTEYMKSTTILNTKISESLSEIKNILNRHFK